MKAKTLGGFLALTAGTAGLAIWLCRRTLQPVPARVWLAPLAESRGRAEAGRILTRAEIRYRGLVKSHPLPRHPALQRHLLNQILPGLALYQELLALHGGDTQAALAEIGPVFETWTAAQNRMRIGLFRLFPSSFAIFRLVYRIGLLDYPRGPWDFRQIEDSARRVAFDNYSCYYLDTLTAYGAPELTTCFCQMDDWLGEILPEWIKYRRTQTLGRGDECCDFRYDFIFEEEVRTQ